MTAHEAKALRLIKAGRKFGFLEDVEDHRFKKREPVVDVFCSDFQRNHEATAHLARLRGYEPHEDPQVHSLRWHGGAMRMVPGSRSNKNLPVAHEIFFAEVLDAPAITNILLVHLRAHFLCGKARQTGTEPEEVIDDLTAARIRLRHSNPKLDVSTFLHVDYRPITGEGKMRNYYVCPRKWLNYRRANPTH